MFNVLFEPSSNHVTALLDFDFSHIASPADEYFHSFRTFGALLAGSFEQGDEGLLRTSLLQGFYGKVLSEPDVKGRVNLTVAMMFSEESQEAGLHGCGELAALHWYRTLTT